MNSNVVEQSPLRKPHVFSRRSGTPLRHQRRKLRLEPCLHGADDSAMKCPGNTRAFRGLLMARADNPGLRLRAAAHLRSTLARRLLAPWPLRAHRHRHRGSNGPVDRHVGWVGSLVGPTVFAVGADAHYVVAQQHPSANGVHFDRAVTNYFIVDRSTEPVRGRRDTLQIFGPLSKAEFDPVRADSCLATIPQDVLRARVAKHGRMTHTRGLSRATPTQPQSFRHSCSALSRRPSHFRSRSVGSRSSAILPIRPACHSMEQWASRGRG